MTRPVVHELKTWPEPFQALVDGRKTFEIRVDDRGGFKVGDLLKLEEYVPPPAGDPGVGRYTGRWLNRTVSYIARGWGLPDGMVVMALAEPTASVSTPSRRCTGCSYYEHQLDLSEPCEHSGNPQHVLVEVDAHGRPRPSDAEPECDYVGRCNSNKCPKHGQRTNDPLPPGLDPGDSWALDAHGKSLIEKLPMTNTEAWSTVIADHLLVAFERGRTAGTEEERIRLRTETPVASAEDRLEELRAATQALADENFSSSSNAVWTRWEAAMAAATRTGSGAKP